MPQLLNWDANKNHSSTLYVGDWKVSVMNVFFAHHCYSPCNVIFTSSCWFLPLAAHFRFIHICQTARSSIVWLAGSLSACYVMAIKNRSKSILHVQFSTHKHGCRQINLFLGLVVFKKLIFSHDHMLPAL